MEEEMSESAANGPSVPDIVVAEAGENYEDIDKIREAAASPQYENVRQASIGRAAANRSSTKNSTRRKSTLRQSGSGARSRGRSQTSEKKSKVAALAPGQGAKRYFAEDAGVGEILAALMAPDDGQDVDGILRCLLALEHSLEADPANSGVLGGHQEGLALIITLIGRYESMDNIVATGLWTLSNIAVTEELAVIVNRAGGDECSLEVLARSKRPPEMVVHAAIALLCNLVLHESLRPDLARKSALPRTLRALDTYSGHEWIQYTAIQTLQNFANTRELCEAMLEQNAVQRVAKAMKYFSDHEELLQSSNWILSCLLFSTDDGQRAALQAEHKVATIIVQSLKESTDHVGVHFTGLSALSNLGRNEDLVEDMVQAGVVEICAQALRMHKTHEGVQMVAGRCLVIVSGSLQAKQDFKKNSVGDLCDGVCERFPDSNASAEASEANRLYTQGKACCVVL